jgi:hypothetical protein
MTDYRPSCSGCSTRSSEHRQVLRRYRGRFPENDPDGETIQSRNLAEHRWSRDIKLDIQDESENEEPEEGKSLQRRQSIGQEEEPSEVIVADAIDQEILSKLLPEIEEFAWRSQVPTIIHRLG